MNFNLISPETNGNDFTIDFRDPITIEENSEISVNWVELKRKGAIKFFDDQTIKFDSVHTLPKLIPADQVDNTVSFTATIPKGLYELSKLQETIQEKMREQIFGVVKFEFDTDGDGNPVDRYRASDVEQENVGLDNGLQNDGRVGMVLNPNFLADSELGELDISATNKHDAISTPDFFYKSNNNTGSYDNYANVNKHFDFFRGNCPTDQPDMNSYALWTSRDPINGQTGRIGFGLVGAEYTDGIGGAPPTRTTGDNPPVLVNNVPACFIWIDCGATGDDFVIYMAQNAGGNTINTWKHQNQAITGMVDVFRAPVATLFDNNNSYQLLFGMEIKDPNSATPELIWKVANYQGAEYVEIYNSETARRNLPFDLCVASTGITYDNATAINSQIPFTFQMSVEDGNDEGWENLRMTAFNKSNPPAPNTNPVTIVREYKLTISEELAKVLNLGNIEGGQSITSGLFPNQCNEDAKDIETDLDFNWRSHNYSIFINLPTNNYKNVVEQRNGGFKKSILANIPSPFTTGTITQAEGSDAGEVISIYQPYQPIVSDLKNNKIQTNTFHIKIVNMDKETPAVDIDRSVINFTIRDKKNN